MNLYIRYFGYFAWLLLLAYIQRQLPRIVTKHELVQDRTVTRYNWVFAILAAAPLAYLAATRGWFADTSAYRTNFLKAPSSFSGIPAYMTTLTKDKGFYFCSAVIKCIIGYRPIVYLGIIACVQLWLLLRCTRKYSVSLLISLFIFVASTDFLSWMQNGLRQFLAACIIFGCSRFIFEKKYIQAIIAVVIASFFHKSALLMIPVIFIVQGEPWNKSTVLILLTSLLAVFFVDRFTNLLDDLLSETQYTNVVTDFLTSGDNGTNPIRVAVYSVPAILSLLGLPYIREEDDHVLNICVNMSVITAGLYFISMVTSCIFLGRLPIYTSMFANLILLPWEVKNIFSKDSSVFVTNLMFVLYLMFYFYQIHFSWSLI